MTEADHDRHPGADGQRIFSEQRPQLMGIAYRMLGSVADAEDVVRDAFLRWRHADRSRINNPAAWLTRIVTKLCVRLLESAARHQGYVGIWLPEPVPTADGALGPLATIAEQETLSFGLLRLLELLSSQERATFVLYEAFGYRHREIGRILDISEQSSRQLLHRARSQLATARRHPHPFDRHDHRQLVRRFLAAARQGDVATLRELLAADAQSWVDGNGRTTARAPILGRENTADYWAAIARRPEATSVDLARTEFNGRPGLLARRRSRVIAAASFDLGPTGIESIWLVVNPDKLGHLSGP
ncbi:MAG TPA: sigma-70 family RNA polymerase sigma factor [Microlunatus sp.]